MATKFNFENYYTVFDFVVRFRTTYVIEGKLLWRVGVFESVLPGYQLCCK